MSKIKTFRQLLEKEQTLSQEQIGFLDKCTKGSWGVNPETGLVDVDGNFNCSGMGISGFLGIRFGEVSGDFSCYGNQLISLEGAPKSVVVNFDCSHNRLTSLKGAPKSVGWDFMCHHNRLTTLDGAPESVNGNFYCSNNGLTSLENAPKSVGWYFNCSDNPQLVSLEGAPKEIGDGIICDKNPIPEDLARKIIRKMGSSRLKYPDVVKSLWKKIPFQTKVLIFDSNWDWIPEGELKKLKPFRRYQEVKAMI